MLLDVILLCQLLTVVVRAGYETPTITCFCSTTHCVEHQISTCNTTGVCFSQYLDRGDGSHPVVKGCIASKTPLLCENRRPAVAKASWPVLLCCDSNFCNRDVVPTPSLSFAGDGDPPSARDSELEGRQQDAKGLPQMLTRRENPLLARDRSKMQVSQTEADLAGYEPGNGNRSVFPRIMSPVYISVLVLGLVSLAVIGVVAGVVLRRNRKFYAEQYGALEKNEECFKQPLNEPRLEEGDCEIVENSAMACAHHHYHHHHHYHECDYRLPRFEPCLKSVDGRC